MKLLIFILALVTVHANARSESSLERTVRCSNNPNSYSDCRGSSSSSSSWGSSDNQATADNDGMNATERAYCKETGSCGANAPVAREIPKPQAQRQAAPSDTSVPAYLLPPKRDDQALRAMHTEISGRIATLESYIQSRQYGASAELAQQLIVYAQEQVGFDAEVQLQDKIRVQPGAFSWPNQQRNDAMAIALKQYRGGLYVQLLNMYKRVKLMWTVANYNLLKQKGSIKPGAKETLRNEMLTAYMVPIYFVDQMQPQAYVLTFDFMLVNPVANFHYNAELEIIADSLKELGFTSETFVEQAKSLALNKAVFSAQQAPVQQQAGANSATAVQPGRDLSSVLLAREDEKQAQIIPTMLQSWARANRRTTVTNFVEKSRTIEVRRSNQSWYANVTAEGVLADGAVCKFELMLEGTSSGATGRRIISPSLDYHYIIAYCY